MNDRGGRPGSSGDRKTEDEEAMSGEEEDEELGKRVAMKKLNPRVPTRMEREEHALTHLPFRNWCRHCVRGRGREEDRRKSNEEPNIPEVHLDFTFMGEENGGAARWRSWLPRRGERRP